EAEMGLRATLMHTDQQLAAYQDVNWQRLEEEDPIAAQSHWRTYQTLKEQRQQVEGNLWNAQQQRLHTVQQETAQRLEATRAAAQKINGWTPEIDAQVTQYACDVLEATPEQLAQVITPAIYKVLHRAWVGEQSI